MDFRRFKADQNWNIKEINYGFETIVLFTYEDTTQMKKKRGAKDQTTETTQTDTPHRNKKRPDRTTTNRKPQTTQNSHSASKSNKQLDLQQVFEPKKKNETVFFVLYTRFESIQHVK